ncbi:L-lysine cyclodeaminase [compost metagenome]|uniref:ornithine cyclodeaminase family protein n=1 Tax=Pseudomonas TaxID=286 RepID=UPI000646D746|nr:MULTISPECIES: ornithine cyclodeaminase [Pseudomonas]MCX2706335.1 ornithine cyclodeaminase family protein [Pseudomonas sp. DCB_BG]
MLLLNAQDIRDCTDVTELVAVLARDYRASVRTLEKVPPRHVIEHPAHQAFSLFMPAVLSDRKVMGVKVSSFFPGNVNRGLPAINGAVLLLDSDTGRLQAMLDSCALTALRTAAMSALATDRLCPVAQPTLAVIGAGVQAKAHIEAIAAIRALRRVRVVARDLDRCHAFAVSMSEQVGVPVEAVKSVEQALLDADIVCTTTSHDKPSPLIQSHQLKPGVHINAIGGSTLQACEVDPCLLSQALIHVDDPQAAMHESGEISQALARSLITPEQVVGLEAVLQEPALPWHAATSYFRCVGHASQDMIVAMHLYTTALERQLGHRCDYFASSMKNLT